MKGKILALLLVVSAVSVGGAAALEDYNEIDQYVNPNYDIVHYDASEKSDGLKDQTGSGEVVARQYLNDSSYPNTTLPYRDYSRPDIGTYVNSNNMSGYRIDGEPVILEQDSQALETPKKWGWYKHGDLKYYTSYVRLKFHKCGDIENGTSEIIYRRPAPSLEGEDHVSYGITDSGVTIDGYKYEVEQELTDCQPHSLVFETVKSQVGSSMRVDVWIDGTLYHDDVSDSGAKTYDSGNITADVHLFEGAEWDDSTPYTSKLNGTDLNATVYEFSAGYQAPRYYGTYDPATGGSIGWSWGSEGPLDKAAGWLLNIPQWIWVLLIVGAGTAYWYKYRDK